MLFSAVGCVLGEYILGVLYLTKQSLSLSFCHKGMCFFSEEFIDQGGHWEEAVLSHKTQVVPGVPRHFVLVGTRNIDCYLLLLGTSTKRERVHSTTGTEGNLIIIYYLS